MPKSLYLLKWNAHILVKVFVHQYLDVGGAHRIHIIVTDIIII